MNEHIRRLAMKTVQDSPNMRLDISDMEYFAVMLIRECAEVCDSGPFGNDYYADRIKEHFGVES